MKLRGAKATRIAPAIAIDGPGISFAVQTTQVGKRLEFESTIDLRESTVTRERLGELATFLRALVEAHTQVLPIVR